MQNQFSRKQPDLTRLRTVWQLLQTGSKAVAKFMVHRPQSAFPQGVPPSIQRYSEKAKLYPYLPASEEQRDWLEHLYQQS